MNDAATAGAQPPTYDALVAASGLPRLEARALVESASGRRREWLIAHGDETAPAAVAATVSALAQRRAAGEPLAYLTGEREFYGRPFRVSNAVLIPRPETELLVQWAIERAPPAARVLELGTGSGAIAITLALERTDVGVLATDLSVAALTIARENASALIAAPASESIPPAGQTQGKRLAFLCGNWYGALAACGDAPAFDLIVSNPPYIAAGDPHLLRGDLRFEPLAALTDHADGLDALRAIVNGAPGHLAPGGWLAFEHGWDQGEAARELLSRAGFEKIDTLRDGEGRERVSFGTPARPTRPRLATL